MPSRAPLPGQVMQVDVAAADDYTDATSAEALGMLQQRSKTDGPGGLHHLLHAAPLQAHGLDRGAVRDRHNGVYKLTDNSEVQLTKCGAQAVGNGIRSGLRLQFAQAEGTERVIGASGLSGDHLDIRIDGFGGDSGSRQQAAAANGHHDSVEIGCLVE